MQEISLRPWLAALVLLAQPAAAQEPAAAPDYARDSFYFAVQGLYAFADFGNLEDIDALNHITDGLGLGGAPVPGGTATGTAGAGARLGYRSGHIGFEADFEWLDQFDFQSRTPAGANTVTNTIGEARCFTGTVNGRIYFLTGRFQPYFVGGIGAASFQVDPTGPGKTSDNTGFVGRVGGGAEYYLTERFGAFGEFTHVFTTGNIGGLDYHSIAFGVLARF